MDTYFTKGIQSADDPLEFVMSEESNDRHGDIIEAKGWELKDFLKNPIALWAHNHAMPVGTWENVRVVGKQLRGFLKFAAAGTSKEIDTLRSLVEQRILKAVSVGFRPIEYEELHDESKRFVGYRFKKQALHETSLVAIPAHANALAVAKSFGMSEAELKSLLGQNAAPALPKSKGTAVQPVARITPTSRSVPMNIADKILAKRARLTQIKDRLTELKNLAEVEGNELTADEQSEVATLTDEIASVDGTIKSLEGIEAGIASKAVPVLGAGIPNAPGPAARKEKGGQLLARLATARLISHVKKAPINAVIDALYGRDDRVKAAFEFMSDVQKTGTTQATTTAAGWAAELVESDLQGFLEELQPVSIYAGLRPMGVPLMFGGAHAIVIPRRNTTRSALNDVGGSWVGEGGVIPVKQIALASQTLYRYKSAVISTFTQEILEQSTPSIEGIVRQAILDDTAMALDGALLGASAVVAGVRPAGLMLGVTPTGSSGNTAENIITDLKVLFKAMVDAKAQRPVLIMNPNRLLGLSTVTTAAGGFMFRDELAGSSKTLLGVPVLTSTNVTDTVVMIVDAASFASANDTPDFNISDQATLTMANADGTAPTQANASGGTTIGTAEQVIPGGGIDIGQAANTPNAGYTSLSLYQTYSTALRMILPTSWGLIRPNVVASLSGVNW
jgi:HK97 family phage major capsid protein/HK97 family phage prohead protease